MIDYNGYKIQMNPYHGTFFVVTKAALIPAKSLAAAKLVIDELIENQLTVKLVEPKESFHE